MAVSYNQPKFCQDASWRRNATTFADNSSVGTETWSIFVDENNTVYAANKDERQIQVWLEGNSTPARTILINSSKPYSLFVSSNGEIYTDVSDSRRVDKWHLNGSVEVLLMGTPGRCYGLFVDINETIYCSLIDHHIVVSKSRNDTNRTADLIVGTGCPGMTSERLYEPWGIFVDTEFNLYVADSRNDRVQKFKSGEKIGTTVAGMGAPDTIELDIPTGVILDGDGHLFIVERFNHRVVRSGPHGFECIVNCDPHVRSAADSLHEPRSLAFDRYGSIYVMDTGNDRIQVYHLATNSCGQKTLQLNYDQFRRDEHYLYLDFTTISATEQDSTTVAEAGPSFYSSRSLDEKCSAGFFSFF